MIHSPDYSAINYIRAIRWQKRRIVPIVAIGAATAVAVTGCSSAKHNASAPQPSTGAQRAIKLAASRSQEVNTLVANLTEHSTSSTAGGTTTGLTGTIKVVLKPATLIAANFTVPAKNAKSLKLEEILTGQAIYFKDPAFSKAAGKTWLKVKISQLSSKTSVTVVALLQNLEGSNPLDQTRLFTASKDVKVVGTQKIHGIATTEYAGTYSPETAFGELSTKLRTLLGPTLRAMGNSPVHFVVWIDGRHIIRKARDTDVVRGQSITTIFNVTSVNKPVKITLPKPGDVGPMPKL